MTVEIAKLNLPMDSMHFLLNHQIKGNEFECLNVEFYTYSNGFLLDVVEWTKQNDFSLSILDKEYTKAFLASLEKFKPYLVIGSNMDSGNLITIYQPTGEIYELEHEITERVERYFVNSSIEKMYCCFNYFKKYWVQLIEQEHYKNHDLIKTFYELKNTLAEFDTNILINDDDYNRQFWNSLYQSNLNFLLEKSDEK
ncbi:SUKH-4 family immunity protein [Bacillus nitratireducens]|uniref:SUKH-4 family immunity protein n=1 Tax=Bacillus nitratireducens TaxID=2026193 RepID=UPI003395200B